MVPSNCQPVDESGAHELLVRLLVESKCIKFGQFVLKSGLTSPHYIDLREATMHPTLFGCIVDLLKTIIPADRKHDSWQSSSEPTGPPPSAIVGIPYGVVPLAAALAFACKLPYYPVRKETKDYGNKPDERAFDDHEFILVEDVMSTGSSIIDTIKKMDGKKITDVIVIVDREHGGSEKLAQEYPHIKVHSLLKIGDIMKASQSS